jgi:hypothetical protein
MEKVDFPPLPQKVTEPAAKSKDTANPIVNFTIYSMEKTYFTLKKNHGNIAS